MAQLSHPSIWDGWFHERNEMWKGCAFTLQVEKILHVEKSKFQDVLVFKSVSYGNVLVLDGVIQCTERDEFSYQEMIAHLPLNSHPNPENVLVIGGGDGGVLREVLKYPTVKKAVLCDIDEAVPRVSKLYLPNMAAALEDKRVQLHIGDGFEFLRNYKGEFDAIITDSSDPVGPAESLFQTPYFVLLKEALRPGGCISTQGESIWYHLPLISKLINNVKELFPTVDYAYTSIPSYPSGVIGFVICSLDADRQLKAPLREIPNTKYYNTQVHKAAFVLPQFAQDGLSNYVAEGADVKPAKKILLLGSGFVAQPAADYILRHAGNQLTIGCRTVSAAQKLASSLKRPAEAVSIDVNDTSALEALVAKHDLVISLIPYTYHAAVIEAAIKGKTHVVTTSYVSDAMMALDAKAKEAGIVVLNEIGVDPGVDHLYAVKMFDQVHKRGGKVKSFISYCGGLPAPASADNPLGYKFSWSSRGVLLALMNSAKYYEGGKVVEVDGKELMSLAQPYYISPAFAFVAYPNRDSTSFREKYNIPEAEKVIRGTLRYQGFPEFIKALVEIGLMDTTERADLKAGTQGLVWNQVFSKAIGAKDTSEAALIARIDELASFKDKNDRERILNGLKWIGLFSSEAVSPRGSLLDTLCATLESKMQYEKGERDMLMLQHKFEVQWADGAEAVLTSTLLEYGAPIGSFEGPSAMARLVGVPCGVGVQLVLDGKISRKGILAPYDMEIVTPLLEGIEKEGIMMDERGL